MTVYVDTQAPIPPTRRFPYTKSCHLFADTEAELHAFATRLGLRREWYQADSILPHYDLTANKHRKAVSLGAQEVTRKEIGRRIYAQREKRSEVTLGTST